MQVPVSLVSSISREIITTRYRKRTSNVMMENRKKQFEARKQASQLYIRPLRNTSVQFKVKRSARNDDFSFRDAERRLRNTILIVNSTKIN